MRSLSSAFLHTSLLIVVYQIASVNWLLWDCKYHHGKVDLKVHLKIHWWSDYYLGCWQNQTTNGLPFQTPLLGMLFRGYLIKGKPKQDKLLIARLHREERIPIPFIVMATVLVRLLYFSILLFLKCQTQIGHALQEYASGSKVENAFSTANLTHQWVSSYSPTIAKILSFYTATVWWRRL